MRDLLRAPAELRTQAELDALVATDQGAKPPGWRLSPRAVETYLMGSPKPVGGVTITPKYVGDRAIVQVAIATLASDRALLLVGEPGTAKSWLSEHLAAGISGTSALVVQGTAGTTEDQIKYGWNYALLLAEGPSRRALVPSPVLRAMEGGQFVRFEEVTRAAAEVQDALISILSEKQIAVPELDEIVTARRGFNVIATANSRDRGVNEMSAALKRRFNFVTVPVIDDPEQEARVVTQREAELRADYQVGAAPPPELARMLVTMFQELRRGMTRDGRTKLRAPDAVLSTAEAISVLFQGGILAQSFGSGQTGVDEIARALVGAVTKDGNDDVKVLREYLETVAKHRPSPWKELHERAKARLPKLGPPAPTERAMADLDRVLFCPVRHHSPRSSAAVRALLDRERPRVVLIEGPSDAGHLAPLLLDPDTEPPVALLGYRTGGEVASAFWPFAAYSPEYVALRWASENGAEARFIDIPASVSLAEGARALREKRGDDGGEAGEGDGEGEGPTIFDACAEGAGVRTFEELWESHLEAPAHGPDDFRELVVEFAHLARLRPRAIDRARDAYMLRHILAARAAAGDGGVAVVAGASHVAALVAGDVDPAREADLPAPVEAALTVIPYSFTRLSEGAGYGAGNRAPRFFQRAFERGCDFERASLDSLLELAAELRLEGHFASLADALEAFRLARTLAGVRGKPSPGLDEVFEASTATFGRGDRSAVEGALSRIVVGSQVGRVTKKAGRGSLQREFWHEVRRLGLPEGDLPRQVLLHLTQDAEVEASTFLQRLRVAGVPYAHYLGLTRVARGYAPPPGAPPAKAPAAGGVEALRRATEAWEAQWTPATEAVLVERVVLGDSLEAACTRLLCDRANEAKTTGEAAECVLDAALAGCVEAAGRTLDRCERLAAGDDDVASLAHGCAVLSCLLRYGGARLEALSARSPVGPLCVHWFRRAVLRLPAAAACGDDAAPALRAAMRALHDVALTQPAVDPDLWWDALERIEGDFGAHASLSGFALGLLHLVERAGDARVADAFALRLGPGAERPARAAAHVAGFLEVNPQAVVRSRPVVAALDGFLASLDPHAFRDLLPALRKAFARLGAVERRLLLEGVFAARGLDRTAEVRVVVSAGEREALAAIGADLDQAMSDLDDLL